MNSIIEFLTDHPEGSVADFEILLGLKTTRIKELLKRMIDDGIIEAIGANRNRRYRLKK